MIMTSPVRDRAVTDVHTTAAFHNDIASDLFVIHGLSGADTIAALHGIGEAMALKVARKVNSLSVQLVILKLAWTQ